MLGTAILAALKWEAGGIWKYSPPIWGFSFGIILAATWSLNGTNESSFFEVVLVSSVLGWGFWLCVWAETKFGK